jgi:hypothetical protein
VAGRIYSPQLALVGRPIYHGRFGAGASRAFTPPAVRLMAFSSLEFHILVTLPLFVC